MSEDLSAMEYVHIDMWTADATDVKFTPISGTGEFLVGLTPINSGSWTSYDIPVGDFTGVSFNDIFQLKFDGQGGVNPSNIWLDNIYFYKEGAAPTEPTVAAPTPTHDAMDVISVFSDTYTNISVADFNPGWGQSGSASQVSVAGNNTLKYENFNFQGTQFTGSEDLAAMEFVHLDMWTADATVIKFSPISASSGELQVSLTPITSGQWVSYEIPLTDFTTVTFNDIHQLIFNGQDGTNPSNIWLDNIYFYKESGVMNPCDPPSGLATSLPVDFEGCETLTGVFEDGDGVAGYPVANPDMTGNASSKVYQYNKVDGAAWYSGLWHVFQSNYDMTTTQVFKMKVWSSKANAVVRFQIEKEGNQGPIVTYQVDQTVVNANTWTELTFDFSSWPFTTGTDVYDRITIFPDFVDDGPSDGNIFYIDDIQLTN
ncbi:MAG: hypothetical protein GY751_16150 [Bacteroidetes bacterium]|nr:hypothetical protein [Bacteroidota bacterium]